MKINKCHFKMHKNMSYMVIFIWESEKIFRERILRPWICLLFRIQIRYDNVCRNSNSFVMFYLFWLLSKIGHFQVCWLIQDVRGSRAQVKWLAVIVSLENDIFGIAYTSTVRPSQSNSNWYLVKFLSGENFIRRCHHKNVSWWRFNIFLETK